MSRGAFDSSWNIPSIHSMTDIDVTHNSPLSNIYLLFDVRLPHFVCWVLCLREKHLPQYTTISNNVIEWGAPRLGQHDSILRSVLCAFTCTAYGSDSLVYVHREATSWQSRAPRQIEFAFTSKVKTYKCNVNALNLDKGECNWESI